MERIVIETLHQPGVLKERFAIAGQLHAARGSVEQGRADRLFSLLMLKLSVGRVMNKAVAAPLSCIGHGQKLRQRLVHRKPPRD